MDAGTAQDTDFHGYGASIRERLSELIPRDGDIRILDIGTGMGSTAAFLLQHLSKGSRIWSVDPSDDVIAKARTALAAGDQQRTQQQENRVRPRERRRSEVRGRLFRLVVSVMVMHHIEAVGGSIAEMSRVLTRVDC